MVVFKTVIVVSSNYNQLHCKGRNFLPDNSISTATDYSNRRRISLWDFKLAPQNVILDILAPMRRNAYNAQVSGICSHDANRLCCFCAIRVILQPQNSSNGRKPCCLAERHVSSPYGIPTKNDLKDCLNRGESNSKALGFIVQILQQKLNFPFHNGGYGTRMILWRFLFL